MEKRICCNPYCKVWFEYEPVEDKIGTTQCPKCDAQSDMVSWEEKRYEGDRWDNTPHKFAYKIKKYY